jgi:queuosine precursor transporter
MRSDAHSALPCAVMRILLNFVIIRLMNNKWLPVITGLFVGVLLISNVASVKLVYVGPFNFDGGTLLFPLSYIFGDILTEVYGYRASRKVIWTGFVCAALMALTFWVVGKLPAPVEWTGEMQSSYQNILMGSIGRIVIASLIAYFAGEFSNSYILAKMKILSKGKYLWTRTIGSTLVGEGIDTALFCLIAFYGTWSNSTLVAVIVSNYVFKCLFEIVATPITYAVVIGLKRAEGVDVYDYHTNFNPFRVFESEKDDAEGSHTIPGTL